MVAVGRMENLTHGDMSVSALVRLLEAAGYDLEFVKAGFSRTLDDLPGTQDQDFVSLAMPVREEP